MCIFIHSSFPTGPSQAYGLPSLHTPLYFIFICSPSYPCKLSSHFFNLFTCGYFLQSECDGSQICSLTVLKHCKTEVSKLRPKSQILLITLQRKFYWNKAMLIWLPIIHGYFCTITAELSSWNRDHLTHKTKYYCLAFTEKACQQLIKSEAFSCMCKGLHHDEKMLPCLLWLVANISF